MSADPTGALLKAVRGALASDAQIAAAVGDRIATDWGAALASPFIRVSVPRTLPDDDECGVGAETKLKVHVWSRDGEIACAAIAGRVRTVLQNGTFPIVGHELGEVTYEGTDYRPDAHDEKLSMGVASFTITTTAI